MLMETFREAQEVFASTTAKGACISHNTAESIITIEHVMIYENTGQAAYVVVHIGCFVAMGGRPLPIAWSMLRDDEALGCSPKCGTQGSGCYPVARDESGPAREKTMGSHFDSWS